MPADASRAASSTRAVSSPSSSTRRCSSSCSARCGAGLGPLGPLVLVGLLPLDAADHLRQLVEEGTDLGGVVPLPDGGELPAGDARRIERRLGRHGPASYDPNRARAEGRFSDLSSVAERPGNCWRSRRWAHRRRGGPPPRTTGRVATPRISRSAPPRPRPARADRRRCRRGRRGRRAPRRSCRPPRPRGRRRRGRPRPRSRRAGTRNRSTPSSRDRGRLLPGAADRPDRAVGRDRAGDGHVGAAGQVAGGEVVDDGQREGQPGRGAADVARVDRRRRTGTRTSMAIGATLHAHDRPGRGRRATPPARARRPRPRRGAVWIVTVTVVARALGARAGG